MAQHNLDNYFAKFLSSGRRSGTPAVSNAAGFSPARATASSPEEAAQSPTSPNAAENPLRSVSPPESKHAHTPLSKGDTQFVVLTDRGVETESLLAEAPSSSRKRGRDEESTRADRRLGPPPPLRPTPQAHLTSGHSKNDDDDDLDLLLGKEQAEQVKAFDALMDAASASVQAKVSSPVSGRAGHAASGSSLGTSHGQTSTVEGRGSAVVPMASLPWSTSSNQKMKDTAMCFTEQFKFELKHSAELFDSFEPFFLDKKLARIEAATDLRCQFNPAPRITASSTGAISGCQLRDYQVEGVQYLLDNFHRGMSCILSDDMGLGKTAQIASFIHVLKRQHGIEGPHLIVAPLSTLTNWTRELTRWAPSLRVVKYHGERSARQAARHAANARHAVFVTTPAVLNQESGFFRKRSWVTVLVDEAHVLKGHNTRITRIAHKLTACFRVAITGTPVHNNVREVWNLMSFLYPSFVAGYDHTYEDTVQAAQNCARLLQHIMLRRTKENMELGIPPRVDEPLTFLDPTYVQSELLARLTAQALHGTTTTSVGAADDDPQQVESEEEGGLSGNTGRLYAHLSHQRVVCNHPMQIRLLAADAKCGSSASFEERFKVAGIPITEEAIIRPSAKMVYLDALLKTLKADGHRVLIFSNFTTTLDLLQALCHLREYPFERLDGSCTRVERELAMLRFNAASSSCFIFLVTTTAGGVGVTLTGADTVILYDAHFNPQLDRQAADRAHRIGQTRVVHVHRLCLRNTVEEHIRSVAERKASLGDFIVEGGRREPRTGAKTSTKPQSRAAPLLSAEDIRAMFEQAELRAQAQREQQRQQAGSSHSALSGDISASQRAAREVEDALVNDLMAVEESGLPGPTMPSARVHTSHFADHYTSDRCLVCGDIMHPLEPLLHCAVCPKSFHATCIGMKPAKPGEVTSKRTWSCPRHHCQRCGKQAGTDGAIFMCTNCPRSFCYDCLDPRYLTLNEQGTELLHIHKTYPEMEAEGVHVKRSCYYLTCLRCCGIESSSEEDESGRDDGSDEDDDDKDDGDEEEAAEGAALSSSSVEIVDEDTD